jgi:predicted RNA binding protein YcfA (HicA-like mRNA interferase family)
MTKHQKALAKLTAIPSSNMTWDELRTVLEHLGYVLLKGSGSRRKFYQKDSLDIIICHEPHPSPDVSKACVRDVVKHLRATGILKE